MKIGVLSDTHNAVEATRRAVDQLVDSDAEVLIHCGDFTEWPMLEVCTVGLPFYFVFGNNDADTVPSLTRSAAELGANCLEWRGMLELGGKRLGVTHGHMKSDVAPLLEAKPDYLLTGHSHQKGDWHDGPTRRVCPGALYRAKEYTVALIDLDRDDVRFLTIKK